MAVSMQPQQQQPWQGSYPVAWTDRSKRRASAALAFRRPFVSVMGFTVEFWRNVCSYYTFPYLMSINVQKCRIQPGGVVWLPSQNSRRSVRAIFPDEHLHRNALCSTQYGGFVLLDLFSFGFVATVLEPNFHLCFCEPETFR